MSDQVDYITTIRESNAEIGLLKEKIKIKKEMISDHIEQKQEWIDLESAKEEVSRKRYALNAILTGDVDYNNSMEQLADLKEELKDRQDTLSTFIVGYHTETKETQVEMGGDGEARQLIIKGRLGKRQKYQTSLFNGGSHGSSQEARHPGYRDQD